MRRWSIKKWMFTNLRKKRGGTKRSSAEMEQEKARTNLRMNGQDLHREKRRKHVSECASERVQVRVRRTHTHTHNTQHTQHTTHTTHTQHTHTTHTHNTRTCFRHLPLEVCGVFAFGLWSWNFCDVTHTFPCNFTTLQQVVNPNCADFLFKQAQNLVGAKKKSNKPP